MGQFRHAVIGRLLAAPPAHGELHAVLELMAQEEWEHPVTGEPVRFAVSTLERWYYTALHAARDPVGALGKEVRADAGRHRSVDEPLAHVIATQHENHKAWTYQLHYDNLVALAKEMPALAVPSYASVRRYMRAHGLLRQPRAQDGDRPRPGKGNKEVRSYEREYVNSLWHTDFHQCSRALCGPDGTWQKPQLVAVMDDCSRLNCHGQFYWDETAEALAHGLGQAFQKRKLPGELMSDGGAAMKAAEFREGLADLAAWALLLFSSITPANPQPPAPDRPSAAHRSFMPGGTATSISADPKKTCLSPSSTAPLRPSPRFLSSFTSTDTRSPCALLPRPTLLHRLLLRLRTLRPRSSVSSRSSTPPTGR